MTKQSGTSRTPVEMKQQGQRTDKPVDTGNKPNQPQVGESTDPEVHTLLAQRQDAESSGQHDLVRGIDAELAARGFQR